MEISTIYILSKCNHINFDNESDLFYERISNGGKRIKVHLNNIEIGMAEGYRWAVAGDVIFKKFTMFEFNKFGIPENYFFNGFLFAERISGAGSAGRGCFPTNIYIGIPPAEYKK